MSRSYKKNAGLDYYCHCSRVPKHWIGKLRYKVRSKNPPLLIGYNSLDRDSANYSPHKASHVMIDQGLRKSEIIHRLMRKFKLSHRNARLIVEYSLKFLELECAFILKYDKNNPDEFDHWERNYRNACRYYTETAVKVMLNNFPNWPE